jgi:hypothetical protein
MVDSTNETRLALAVIVLDICGFRTPEKTTQTMSSSSSNVEPQPQQTILRIPNGMPLWIALQAWLTNSPSPVPLPDTTKKEDEGDKTKDVENRNEEDDDDDEERDLRTYFSLPGRE